jgi:hypothetical protein
MVTPTQQSSFIIRKRTTINKSLVIKFNTHPYRVVVERKAVYELSVLKQDSVAINTTYINNKNI